MADPEQDDVIETPAAAPRKRGRWLMIGAVVLLLVAGAVGYAFTRGHADGADKGSKVAQKHPVSEDVLYLPLEPAFVVNLRDADSLRYLQVGITLMTHDSKAIDAVKGADPVIRDALLALFSSQKYSAMIDPAERAPLQAKALAAVQKIVHARIGSNGVYALYFTSFVIQ
ncbi:MAG: flagellar basal body-associated FliL family protein [Pseudomonadota bacterium]|nr:flagellar basal body-associated FliL family protein [Pseudomonadota bacterium]